MPLSDQDVLNAGIDIATLTQIVNGDATQGAIPLRLGGTAKSLRNAAATIAQGIQGIPGPINFSNLTGALAGLLVEKSYGTPSSSFVSETAVAANKCFLCDAPLGIGSLKSITTYIASGAAGQTVDIVIAQQTAANTFTIIDRFTVPAIAAGTITYAAGVDLPITVIPANCFVGFVCTTALIGYIATTSAAPSQFYQYQSDPGSASAVYSHVVNNVTLSIGVTLWSAPSTQTNPITSIFDGAGSAIAVGAQALVTVPYGCTIKGLNILSDVATNTQIDVMKCAFSAYNPGTHPGAGDSIFNSGAKPSLSNQSSIALLAQSGWSTVINPDDILLFSVVSNSLATKLILDLKVVKS